MKLVVLRNTLEVSPETPTEVAYLEDTLGFVGLGDVRYIVRRESVVEGGTIFWLEIGKKLSAFVHSASLVKQIADYIDAVNDANARGSDHRPVTGALIQEIFGDEDKP